MNRAISRNRRRINSMMLLALFLAGCGGPKEAPWHAYSAPDLGVSASFPNPFDADDESVPSRAEGAIRYVTVRCRGNGASLMYLITCAVYPDPISAEQARAAHDKELSETESFAASVSRKDRRSSDGTVRLSLAYATNSGTHIHVEDVWAGDRHIRVIAEGDPFEIKKPEVERFLESVKITPPAAK